MPKSSSKPHILIAEDDKTYANAYVDMFTAAGYHVTVVNRGPDVMASLLHHKPDLLLLDIIMPGLDGFTILNKIRATKRLKDLRVIVASNLSQNINPEKIDHYKLSGYFVKSDISLVAVLDLVKKTLEA